MGFLARPEGRYSHSLKVFGSGAEVTGMLWDLYQEFGIQNNRNRLRHAENDQAETRGQAQDLAAQMQERFDRTVLINEAMWQLLSERVGLTDEQLARRVYELDMSDGLADGRRISQPVECECGAMVNAKSRVCLFCGAAAPARPFFDAV